MGNGKVVCNKQCLLYQTSLYVQAIHLGSVAAIPQANGPYTGFPGLRICSDVVVTNNGSPSTVGAGDVWTHHIVQLQYREVWADPVSQNVMLFTSAKDNTGKYYFYEVRLGFANESHSYCVSEIEELFSNPVDATNNLGPGGTGQGAPRDTVVGDRIFDSTIPKDEQESPQKMVEAANAYWQAFNSTAPDRGYTVPLAPECTRLELNRYMRLGNDDCLSAFTPGNAHFTITNSRIYIIDVARGVVGGITTFSGSGPVLSGTVPVPEMFKIINGLIVEPLTNFGTLGGSVTSSGWPDYRYPGIHYPLAPWRGPDTQ